MKGETDSGVDRRRMWRTPTVEKILIKQITRGGMMFVGSDMMGMTMMVTS